MDFKARIKKLFNQRGEEILDPTPISIPSGLRPPPTLNETIARLVQTEISRQAVLQGQESFEEANDFDVGDDYDSSSPHEEEFYGQFDEEVTLEAERNKRAAKPFKEEKPVPAKKPKAPKAEVKSEPAEPDEE